MAICPAPDPSASYSLLMLLLAPLGLLYTPFFPCPLQNASSCPSIFPTSTTLIQWYNGITPILYETFSLQEKEDGYNSTFLHHSHIMIKHLLISGSMCLWNHYADMLPCFSHLRYLVIHAADSLSPTSLSMGYCPSATLYPLSSIQPCIFNALVTRRST
jgi:hypothetical protein